MFDILKDVCNQSIGQRELEIKLFDLLHDVEAVKYLVMFRK